MPLGGSFFDEPVELPPPQAVTVTKKNASAVVTKTLTYLPKKPPFNYSSQAQSA